MDKQEPGVGLIGVGIFPGQMCPGMIDLCLLRETTDCRASMACSTGAWLQPVFQWGKGLESREMVGQRAAEFRRG